MGSFDMGDMAYTIGVAKPEEMANEAVVVKNQLLKIKCCGDGLDLDRLDLILWLTRWNSNQTFLMSKILYCLIIKLAHPYLMLIG